MGVNSYNTKVVISGDIIELYEYKVPVLEGYKEYKKNSGGRSVSADLENKNKNRKQTLKRAKRDLRRIINSNMSDGAKFVTLTFQNHVTEFQVANYEFKKFKQRLEYKIGCKLKYTCVPEFTKKGRVHFHVILYNCPYIKNSILKDIWGNGFIRINRIDNVDNVGSYVAEYVGKDYKEGTSTSDKMKGKKCYFNSRGLDKPIEIKQKSLIQKVVGSIPANKVVYENTFENEYNSIHYIQYNMKVEVKQRGIYL